MSDTPAEILREAKAAANGLDVRLGGGVATNRAFVDAGLVDALHVVVSPIVFGRGERFWTGPEELFDRYEHEKIASLSGVTHYLFWR